MEVKKLAGKEKEDEKETWTVNVGNFNQEEKEQNWKRTTKAREFVRERIRLEMWWGTAATISCNVRVTVNVTTVPHLIITFRLIYLIMLSVARTVWYRLIDLLLCSQCSVWLRTGRPWFDPRQRQRIVPLTSASGPALGPTQPPVQWVPGALSPGVKGGRGVMLTTHPLLVPRLRNSRSYTSCHPDAPLWSVTGPLYPFLLTLSLGAISHSCILILYRQWHQRDGFRTYEMGARYVVMTSFSAVFHQDWRLINRILRKERLWNTCAVCICLTWINFLLQRGDF
jgi:hypothetical protein